ncbi:hypothetical protein [Actinopolymorpha pittospori]|uniref:Uncharacterized protein n=1 Tax=Actinopolymorpha pittospori TaxID=648752 RepID=A0A927RGM2_9ACTN|nr:hypothetical protein [Actinopolymorpha pittospori]MBE1604351.1 hypothetical protein [Actinopolymorpha pittospori]
MPAAGDHPTNLGPQTSLGFRFTVTRKVTDSTKGPVVHSYGVKALPAVKPQRVLQLLLSCFDFETWQSGQLDGHDGWVRDRLAALQAIEDAGDLIKLQDFGLEAPSGRLVRIEKVSL